MSDHLSTLTLHQLRYGELTPAAQAEAEAHLATCGRCAERLSVQRREREAFVLQPVPEALRAAAPTPRRTWWRWALPLVAAAAALLLFVQMPPSAESPVEGIRYRGEAPAEIELWVDVGDGPRPIREGERLTGGDVVQLAHPTHGATHAGYAGRDHSGEIELYGTFALPDQPFVEAPFALTLDDAPGTQEFFVILGDGWLESATVEEAVRGWPDVADPLILRTTVAKETTD